MDANSISTSVTFKEPATGDLHLASPSDDDTDLFAEHLRRNTRGVDRDAIRGNAVDHVELEAGLVRIPVDRTTLDLTAEADRCAHRLVARFRDVFRTPVVDEVLADPTDGEDEKGDECDRKRTDREPTIS